MKNTKSVVFHLLLVMFLCSSSLLQAISAVPTSRVLKSYEDTLALQDLQTQGIIEGEMVVVEGRMDFESADYPGTGANNRHDPKTPGTV